jgi:hypothetical protein
MVGRGVARRKGVARRRPRNSVAGGLADCADAHAVGSATARARALVAGRDPARLHAVLPLLAFLPGEVALPMEQLRQSVPGLAGITGLLLFPMLGAWARLLLQAMEWGRPGINRPQGISGMGLLRALGITVLFLFFFYTAVRAAGELRSIQAEAPVISGVLQGLGVGIGFWVVYALGLSALRVDLRRRKTERRMGGVLR